MKRDVGAFVVLYGVLIVAFMAGQGWMANSHDNNARQDVPAPLAEILHQWVWIDYVWESEAQRDHYLTTQQWIPKNNALAGIKVYKNEVYVTIPRWRTGVPSTLNKVVVVNGIPLLQPYPDWDANNITTGFRYVQSMEIDSRGWMWIIDVGRLNILDDPSLIVNGSAKLTIYDMNNDCVVRKYEFPESVVAYNDSFLNDIVVDQVENVAYISDTSGVGGIVVYDFKSNSSRYWTDTLNHTTSVDNATLPIVINGLPYQISAPEDGIALNGKRDTLYFCPLTGTHLFSLPTAALRAFNLSNEEIAMQVTRLGFKGYSDGLAYTSDDYLYYGSLATNAVHKWKVGTNLSSATILLENNVTSQWPDTFAFSNDGYFYYVSNRLELYFSRTMEFGTDANFRIWRIKIDKNSYLTASTPSSYGKCGSSSGSEEYTWDIVIPIIVVSLFIMFICGGAISIVIHRVRHRVRQLPEPHHYSLINS